MLFGYAKIVNGDKHLHIADKLYYCEKTDCDEDCGGAVLEFGYNITADCFAYTFGDTANAIVTVAYFAKTSRKRYGVNSAYNTFGHIVAVDCVV